MSNCKQGDLAIIVGTKHLDGTIVTCLSSFMDEDFLVWETTGTFWHPVLQKHSQMLDVCLKPIKPLTDEEKNEFLSDMNVSTKKSHSFDPTKLSNIRSAKERINQLILDNERSRKID